MLRSSLRLFPVALVASLLLGSATSHAQEAPADKAEEIRTRITELDKKVAGLKEGVDDLRKLRLIADVEVFAKAADWILRHNEFYKPSYVDDTLAVLEAGMERAEQLKGGESPWYGRTGGSVHGYVSQVDGSVQPYAISIPDGVNPRDAKRWPLQVVLHGRGSTLNEVSFIKRHDGKAVEEGQTWIQLDVFGRTNNAYRWAGETDVFEAIEDLKRRYRIDERRITLWGFSMGGAGSWHLGLHHPSKWSSVGPGAGFVDFYKYQKQTEKLPPYQDKTLHIYDAIDYALNAFDVPFCTYGGELDAQLVASTEVVEKAEELGVPIKLIIGPGVGHKFHPESKKEFMAFHLEKSEQGKPLYPGPAEIRFTTYTPKYNNAHWLTVEEMLVQYEPALVQAVVDQKQDTLRVRAQNAAVIQIARDVAQLIDINGTIHPLRDAAMGLLPGVYFELGPDDEWELMSYDASREFSKNAERRKRKDLQGPIDDAFMQPFVCVRGTGEPWSAGQHAWAIWTLDRFEREFDKWMRGKIEIVDDSELTETQIEDKNIILFGDPGSNSVLARILDKLEIKWTKDAIEIEGKTYDPNTHGLSLIYPNPLNPRRYVVINSGHTFHEKDFRASNAWLFPRLGDIAVQKFSRTDKGYEEEIIWAEIFNSGWHLPSWRPPGFEESN